MKTISTFLMLGLFFCGAALAEEKEMPPSIVRLDSGALNAVELSPVTEYPFMQVVAGENPTAGSVNAFQSADEKFEVGFYHGSEVTLRLSDWPVHEVMYFLEGQVEITDRKGSSQTFGPGDALVMPKGFSGTWRQLSAIKKISVTYPSE